MREWREIRERAIFDYCKWDVQCEDHSVLAQFPLFIEMDATRFLNEKAEALTREALAAEEELSRRPELLARLRLPRAIQRSLERSAAWGSKKRELRVMRFDFHFTTEGWRISEVNADVPGGFIEASAWNALFAEKLKGVLRPTDTSNMYAGAMREIAGKGGLIALVHATAYSDDRQVMLHLARRFAAEGMRAWLCSPAHLRWEYGRAEFEADFASKKIDAIVRFFPAEWMPNLGHEAAWKPYFEECETPLSNPGSAVVLQTKRFPLVWDELRTELSSWRELLPETREFERTNGAPPEGWVVKPALGRVGEDVGIRGVTPDADLAEVMRRACKEPRSWIEQRKFEIVPIRTEDRTWFPCIGVFTIGGKAAGFYGRVSEGPIIDRNAQDAAVLISGEPAVRGN